jgi:hypothetical protein
MCYTFARVSAAVHMWVEDYYQNGKRWWLRLHEKGRQAPRDAAHHNHYALFSLISRATREKLLYKEHVESGHVIVTILVCPATTAIFKQLAGQPLVVTLHVPGERGKKLMRPLQKYGPPPPPELMPLKAVVLVCVPSGPLIVTLTDPLHAIPDIETRLCTVTFMTPLVGGGGGELLNRHPPKDISSQMAVRTENAKHIEKRRVILSFLGCCDSIGPELGRLLEY